MREEGRDARHASIGVAILHGAGDVPGVDGRSRYLAALMRHGAGFYLDTADVAVKAIEVNGVVVPLVVNDGGSRTSDVWSPSAHYCQYTAHELGKRHPRVPQAVWRGLTRPLAAVLDAASIDRIVFVNNWLFATNPELPFSSAEISALIERLRHAYPDSAIVFRSVNPTTGTGLRKALVENGCRLIRARRIFVLEGTRGEHLERRNARLDRTLLHKTPYEIVRSASALEGHGARLADLYRALYIAKHSPLNPRFNARFFELALKARLFHFLAFVKDGRVDAFAAFWTERDWMMSALAGYDQDLPKNLGLYRLVIAGLMHEAAERRLKLNLSGGAGRVQDAAWGDARRGIRRGVRPTSVRHLAASPGACSGPGADMGRRFHGGE